MSWEVEGSEWGGGGNKLGVLILTTIEGLCLLIGL